MCIRDRTGDVSIAGQITENETNAPVPHAFVQARNNQGMIITVLSNQHGEYQITDLVAGRYSLSAHGFGYRRSLTEIVEVEASSPQTVHLDLSPQADIASQVSGAEWLSLLPDSDETRQFILDCQGCCLLYTSVSLIPLYHNAYLRRL